MPCWYLVQAALDLSLPVSLLMKDEAVGAEKFPTIRIKTRTVETERALLNGIYGSFSWSLSAFAAQDNGADADQAEHHAGRFRNRGDIQTKDVITAIFIDPPGPLKVGIQ